MFFMWKTGVVETLVIFVGKLCFRRKQNTMCLKNNILKKHIMRWRQGLRRFVCSPEKRANKTCFGICFFGPWVIVPGIWRTCTEFEELARILKNLIGICRTCIRKGQNLAHEMGHKLRLGSTILHAPGARMTWVHKHKTPSNELTEIFLHLVHPVYATIANCFAHMLGSIPKALATCRWDDSRTRRGGPAM